MHDPTYNEALRRYIFARQQNLARARRIVDELIDATHMGKFTDAYKKSRRDEAAALLEEYFSEDSLLPSLELWEGDNEPQSIYAGGLGSGLDLEPVWVADYLHRVNIRDGGSGYMKAPLISFQSENGTGAVASGVLGKVVQIVATEGGSGYTSRPSAMVSQPEDPRGDAAVLHVYRGWVESITVTEGGSGYTSPPQVAIERSDESNDGVDDATAKAVIEGGSVTAINLTHRGAGYLEAKSVTISGGGGSGAKAEAVIAADAIGGAYISEAGSGYTSAPEIVLTGGGGSGAILTPVVHTGTVAKVIVNEGGSGYTETAPGFTVTASPPAVGMSTDAEKRDDRYVPDGWSTEPVHPTARMPHIYRSQRCRVLGQWSDWLEPILWREYVEPV